MPNLLATESSAYLQSAAHQPVHWLPWSEAAFERARAEDKPILLDIGAVWCHWCHVMDGESYEDVGVAEVLNREFVCVKVDRDERPDVDELSRVMDLTTGEGGPSIRPVCPRETVLEMSNAVRKVKIAEDVKRYALRLVLGSDPEGEEAPPVVKRCVKFGASPRAAQSMILGGKVRALYRGRYNVSFEDITEMALPSIAHRIILNFEGEMSGMTAEKIVRDLASAVRPE